MQGTLGGCLILSLQLLKGPSLQKNTFTKVISSRPFFNLFFHFYFFTQDFFLNKPFINLKLYKLVDNIQFEGIMSQIRY